MSRIIGVIPPEHVMQLPHDVQPPQLVDCRSAGEFAAGHIPGSVNIPVEELDSRRHDIDPQRPVVFVCASGRRATAAAELLAGGTTVAVLEGGVKAWAARGGELVASTASTWALERQVRLVAGSIAAAGGAAALFDARWALVPILIGTGLVVAALTNTCAMASLLMQLPWNRRRK
jgi:rhodanese-related sulfurtransferase